jgi:anti-anti-sigma factor
MNFKIDTKEIFYVISLNEEKLTANMAEELISFVAEKQKTENKSLVISLQNVTEIEDDAFEAIIKLHENTYQGKKSLVLCELSLELKKTFEQKGLSEKINITPTESEAWDIVQMEEIERELDIDFE